MSTAPGDEFQDDVRGSESGAGADTTQDDYASRTGQNHIPVQKDGAAVESGGYEDREVANSDEQLARDDADAIDQSNIVDSRTRGASKKGQYTEPGDEEGLPGPDDGTSAVSGGPN